MDGNQPAFRNYSVPTHYAPHSQTPSPNARQKSAPIPPQIKRIILDLSLRFQPTDETKRVAFNDRVALLASDCANVPTEWLEVAARRWIETGDGFLPTASALIKLAQDAQSKSIPVNHNYRPGEDGPIYRELLRKQREFAAKLKSLWDRDIPEHELSLLTEQEFRSAIAQGSCLLMRNGARRYRTKATIEENEAQQTGRPQ